MPNRAVQLDLLPSGQWRVWSVSTEGWNYFLGGEKNLGWLGAQPFPGTSHKPSRQPEVAGHRVWLSQLSHEPCGGRAGPLSLSRALGRGYSDPGDSGCFSQGAGGQHHWARSKTGESKAQRGPAAGPSWRLAEGTLEPPSECRHGPSPVMRRGTAKTLTWPSFELRTWPWVSEGCGPGSWLGRNCSYSLHTSCVPGALLTWTRDISLNPQNNPT